MKTFWMSFCDTRKPEGKQFLGVVIVESDSFKNAVIKSHRIGVNPGGEIKGLEIEKEAIDSTHLNKLLSKNQLKEYGYI